MRPFWTGVLEPLLRCVQPKTIVEIGCFEGETTRLLLDFCQQHDAVLHAIDPYPRFDAAAWEQAQAGRLVFHRALSLAALPQVGPMDAVLIDGDHNWYTVFNELTTLERLSAQPGRAFPVVALHDIGWPYARRDLYYDPATIPAADRQPYGLAGMRPDAAEAQAGGGFSTHLNNALQEGGPRNGVLTAIEDYLKATPQCLRFSQVPGFYGLGLLADCARVDANPALAAFLARLNAKYGDAPALRTLEAQRLALEIEIRDRERQTGAGGSGPWPGLARLPLLAAKARRKLVVRQLQRSLDAFGSENLSHEFHP